MGVGMIAAAPFVAPSDNSDDLSMGSNFWYGFAVSAAGSALIGSGLSLVTPALLADASANRDVEDLRVMGWGLVGVGMLASGFGAYLLGQPGEATLTVQIGPNYSGLAYKF